MAVPDPVTTNAAGTLTQLVQLFIAELGLAGVA